MADGGRSKEQEGWGAKRGKRENIWSENKEQKGRDVCCSSQFDPTSLLLLLPHICCLHVSPAPPSRKGRRRRAQRCFPTPAPVLLLTPLSAERQESIQQQNQFQSPFGLKLIQDEESRTQNTQIALGFRGLGPPCLIRAQAGSTWVLLDQESFSYSGRLGSCHSRFGRRGFMFSYLKRKKRNVLREL